MKRNQESPRTRPGTARGKSRLRAALSRRVTIMLIPHSERSALNFHVSILVLAAISLVLVVAVGTFVYLSSRHIGSNVVIESQQQELEENQANLDAALAEIRNVLRVARSFDAELVETMNSLGISPPDSGSGTGVAQGDLAEFQTLQAVAEDRAREIQDLRNAAEGLRDAVEPVREIRQVLQSQESLLADIPNLWPVQNGMGRVAMEFGPNIHPITGQWYLHNGISIAGPPGTPIVASANGRVVEMGYDPDYGLYVMLRHKYGFRTQYSYLQSITVREGQNLVQGQQVGTLGNTGISSRYQLDFMVKLGTDVVDPAAFLKTADRFAPGVSDVR